MTHLYCTATTVIHHNANKNSNALWMSPPERLRPFSHLAPCNRGFFLGVDFLFVVSTWTESAGINLLLQAFRPVSTLAFGLIRMDCQKVLSAVVGKSRRRRSLTPESRRIAQPRVAVTARSASCPDIRSAIVVRRSTQMATLIAINSVSRQRGDLIGGAGAIG